MGVEVLSEKLVMKFKNGKNETVDIFINNPDKDGVKSGIMSVHKAQMEKLIECGIYGTTDEFMNIQAVEGLRFEIRSIDELDINSEN
ncbi:hypothetical protein AN639_11755 [Candidatus Epulonipiscium fishelsonii]|uniref:Uncharacterized protein n=1 Tax=Candidatus Epulonipiscium fishelsonii TaxID=77094 RepID=A0ACC8XD95_9FIRM|nr:hypothetical protein AN396_05310 [Epulopiscium sp. SCG-B11WGA-EpuloA1]ONI42945.1 hypothetical protein AN639_11755 [Epulopiscium sp. SCG-B05WGA-EpuloA1]